MTPHPNTSMPWGAQPDRCMTVMCEAAAAGLHYAENRRAEGITRISKIDAQGFPDFFTEADVGAQQRVLEHLARHFPHIPVVAEEQKSHSVAHRTYFAVDGIDGTHCFVDGEDGWGVVVGLIHEGKVVAGALASPKYGKAHALRGAGAMLNGASLLFDAHTQGHRIVVYPAGPWTPAPFKDETLSALIDAGFDVRATRSSISCAFEVITGNASVYLGTVEKVWDNSAAAIIIEEAGGEIRRSDLSPMSWNTLMTPAHMVRNRFWIEELSRVL